MISTHIKGFYLLWWKYTYVNTINMLSIFIYRTCVYHFLSESHSPSPWAFTYKALLFWYPMTGILARVPLVAAAITPLKTFYRVRVLSVWRNSAENRHLRCKCNGRFQRNAAPVSPADVWWGRSDCFCCGRRPDIQNCYQVTFGWRNLRRG